MDATEAGSKEPSTLSGSTSRWTPLVIWLLAVTTLPIVLVGLTWTHQLVGLPLADSGDGVLDQIVPLTAGLALIVCLISIWRSSSTVVMKILATLATFPVLLVAIMMALLVIFWRYVAASL